MNADQTKQLRAAFPPGTVGKLPKPLSKEAKKGKCPECGTFHGLPAVHLDYVGHAAVTDRLLSVDPEWSWEPMAVDQFGSPQQDREGNLWIRLTVCGVTRIGCGDGSSMKERIGDAIRNAAMRFGVALDLWSKEELESGHAEHKPAPVPQSGEVDLDQAKAAAWDAAGRHETEQSARMAVLIDALKGVPLEAASVAAFLAAAAELNQTAPKEAA